MFDPHAQARRLAKDIKNMTGAEKKEMAHVLCEYMVALLAAGRLKSKARK